MQAAAYKYEQVADQLREQIVGGELAPGSRLPGEQQLANELGINHLTLRKALAQLVDEGMIIKRRRQGTYVAASPRRSLQSVLYVGPTQRHVYSSFYLALTRQAQQLGAVIGVFDPELEDEEGDLRQGLSANLRDKCSIIVSHAYLPMVDSMISPGTRLVVADHHGPKSGTCPGITVDWQAATALATRHLLAGGHRRIAVVDQIDTPADEQRLIGSPNADRDTCVGYLQALAEAGLGSEMRMGQNWSEPASTPAALDHLVQRHGQLPSAFVCVGDFRAPPLVGALAARGLRVPEDISVIGIGNTPWCAMLAPALSSVDLGETEMARLAIEQALGRQPPLTRTIQTKPKVVERDSVADYNSKR